MSGMGKAISAYKKLKLDLIGKFSIESMNVLEEVPLFDEGYIFTQIERLKQQHEDVARELKISVGLNIQSEYERHKRLQLKAKLDSIFF